MVGRQSRAPRKTAFIKAHMRDGEQWLDVSIGNVSSSGLMVRSQAFPPVGATLEIRRRGVTINGEVVWSTKTRFGLRSFEPIDLDALTAESGLNVSQQNDEAPVRRGLWHWRR
jgi:hypothetical protein